MALTARVRTLPDELLARSVHPGIYGLIDNARIAGMPMLGNVDRYDDTTFNRMQVKLVVRELQDMLGVEDVDVVGAARELLEMAEMVLAKPHRYLLFIGD